MIIPDIHTNFVDAEANISKENPDNIVFLGDYFDKFIETYEDTQNTAYWLQESLKKENRIHLLGNHEMNYMTLNKTLKCGGYTTDKYNIVKQFDIQWDKMPLYCWVGDWLCSHAGLSWNFIKNENMERKALLDILEIANEDLKTIHDHTECNMFLQAGKSRGGELEYGGILWGDYSEFVDMPNEKQIFGHTPSTKVRHVKTELSEHICLDTHGKHYAIYENNKMTVKAV
jgi:hypothetical protein